jgi:hypothetical protein
MSQNSPKSTEPFGFSFAVSLEAYFFYVRRRRSGVIARSLAKASSAERRALRCAMAVALSAEPTPPAGPRGGPPGAPGTGVPPGPAISGGGARPAVTMR